MGKIIKKQYYKISFTLSSPLTIGSGFNKETDKDIQKDSLGRPYIPASAIAGISRSAIKCLTSDEINEYFGCAPKDGRSEIKNSKLIFYDAVIVEGEPHISVRDCVGLDEYKVAKKGAKFDMEILEPGVTFETYIEQNYFREDEKNVAESVALLWGNSQMYLGAKTMRGYGAIDNVSVIKEEFDMLDSESVEKWLSFDMYDAWEDAKTLALQTTTDAHTVRLDLKQVGGISIRKYTTRVIDPSEGVAVPDSEQLTVWNDGSEIPVIPGSSWAGAFLHRMRELAPGEDFTALFGKSGSKEGRGKSSIRFSETQIKGATGKTLSRNAIDRFSGGTADSALFTEKTYYGGTTTLEISFADRSSLSENAAKALAAAIADLNYGFLGVGGLTAIGRGLFKVESVNGEKVADDEMYKTVFDILTKEN